MASPGSSGRGPFVLELHLHPGDEFLGSLEPESLQVLTYVKLYIPDTKSLVIKTSCIPMQFLKERPPFLRLGLIIVASGADNVITYFREQLSDGDDQLSEVQQSEVMAYSALLTDKLLPAILYSRWLNSQNYVDFTRGLYAKQLHFPLTLFYLSWQHWAINHLIMRGATPDTTPDQRGLELVSTAEECINLISARLGEQDYFYGDKPSSLDAYMFGYLEVICQSPLPASNSLFMRVNAHTNLVKFCQRMRKKLFPENKTRSAQASSMGTVSTPTTLWRDSTLWVSVGVATFVLCLQGVRVGLFYRIRDWVVANSRRVTSGLNRDS